ncbi:MAG: ribose-phosphate pyrophosphokinase [Erysipelotrichaceae bacterium]|nr:ribose-phosphate pyrophosphokinase [Erysipelotrichaceae bacterium]
MLDRLKLVSLTANEDLTKKISEILNIDITPTKVTHFADGEVLFEGKESFRGNNVYIIQSTCAPVTERLMEVLICCDALKRASARTITCIMPYFGYARQDRKAKARQPISAKLVADLLTTAGCQRIVCTDLHASQIQGFFNIPVDDVSALPIFYRYFKDLDLKDIVCVSPDHGGVVRTSKLAEKLNAPIAIIDKRRPRPNEAEIFAIVGDVKDKDCIIVDDIVDTAGTLCLAAEKLKQLGARHVYAAISHGVLSTPAVERINNSSLEKLVITDTIPLPKEKHSDKIEVLSMAELFSRIIVALEEGKSLSSVHKAFANEHYSN